MKSLGKSPHQTLTIDFFPPITPWAHFTKKHSFDLRRIVPYVLQSQGVMQWSNRHGAALCHQFKVSRIQIHPSARWQTATYHSVPFGCWPIVKASKHQARVSSVAKPPRATPYPRPGPTFFRTTNTLSYFDREFSTFPRLHLIILDVLFLM